MAPNYAEESRDPKRIVPLSLYVSVLALGIFYVIVSWAAVSGYAKIEDAIGMAQTNSANFFFDPATRLIGNWVTVLMSILILSGSFPCGMAFHNTAARYLYSLGRERVLPAALGKTHPVHRTPHIAVIFTVVASMIVSVLAANKFGAGVAFGVVGTTFTVLAIIVYMISCGSCIGFFSREGRQHRNVLLHVVVPILGIVVFAFPLYAQYFDLNKLFSYVLAYPFNWDGIATVVWVVADVVVTFVMVRVKSGALEAATRGFAGDVAEEVV